MFYKLSQESLKKIKELIGDDILTSYTPLNVVERNNLTNKKNYSDKKLLLLLYKFGLKPNNFVGKGVFCIVYKKENKIYKFTLNKNDVLKALALQSIKPRIPEKYEKFVMDIFDFGYDEDSNFYYIVSEVLEPLQASEASILLGNESKIEMGFVATTLITERFVDEILNTIKENTTSNIIIEGIDKINMFRSTKSNLMDDIKNTVESIDFQIGSKDKEKIKEAIVSNARKFGIEIFLTISKFLKNKLSINEEIELSSSRNIMKFISNKYVNFIRFPKNFTTDYSKFDKSRYGFELLEFLEYLKENYQIFFKDLHTGNLMKRPNGDIVLSDVGLFKIT